MNEGQKAAFSIIGYKISNFSFQDLSDSVEIKEGDGFAVKFAPDGLFNTETGEFTLSFQCICEDRKSQKEILSAHMIAEFKIENAKTKDEIPPFFYRNSIAIIFPYLRAFISTMTAQANITPIILPLLNLSGLEQPLKESTLTVEEFERLMEEQNKEEKHTEL